MMTIVLSMIAGLMVVAAIYAVNQLGAMQRQIVQHSERLRVMQETQNQLQHQVSEQLMRSFDSLRGQLLDALTQGNKQTNEQLQHMSVQTDQRLQAISGQVEKRLSEGFEKTTATFHDVMKRLVLIDEAQKKIAALSENVISLEEVLADKRSRGAFGEVQLHHLLGNMLPASQYALQYSLTTGARVDCMLFLPPPTGSIGIDAKFPLENYQRMMDHQCSEEARQIAAKLFKQNIKNHIQVIKSKYIIDGETADGAIMFIPAEAIFAEIHAHHADLVELAYRSRVWLTSPTTLMAILTTIRAVIKDQATRNQVNVIQEHLIGLGKDFELFQSRMDKLAIHINQANKDVDDINTSAKRLTSRFTRIEKADLNEINQLTKIDS